MHLYVAPFLFGVISSVKYNNKNTKQNKAPHAPLKTNFRIYLCHYKTAKKICKNVFNV
jgi:hypothetical protein